MADAFQPKFVDLVRNYSTTVGTGNFTLGPAVNGYTGFTAACAVGDTFYYSAIGVDKPTEREVGRGTLLAGGQISRDPISGTKTNFSTGTKAIALIAAAEWFGTIQAAGTTYLQASKNLSDVASIATSRTNLGLGSAALESVARFPVTVSTRTELASYSATSTAYLSEHGREGLFTWDAADHSQEVAADTAQGIYVALASDPTGASGAWVRSDTAKGFNVAWFGATGAGDETLFATSYTTDVTGSPVTITQQTKDGLAINAALKLLRSIGGGRLLIPKGRFTTYGYLERVDFPLTVSGAGRGLTIIRNCTASPWSHGYGIFCIQPATLAEIHFEGLTLDGYGDVRTKIVAEVRAYPLALYGLPKFTMNDVECRNSPIDTFMTSYSNGDAGACVQITNCLFSASYRNTISLVSGWNQQYTNCIIEKGGSVQGGTAPKACLDIEPNSSANTIKNITFTNCIVREAVSSLMYGVWAGNIRFNGCRFQAFGGTGATGANGVVLPYACYTRSGQFIFSNCTFEETTGNLKSAVVIANDVASGEYATSQYTKFENCTGEGVGVLCFGVLQKFHSCIFRNAFIPFVVGGTNTQDIRINGLELINLFDTTNAGGGSKATFTMPNTFEGTKSSIDGLRCIVDGNAMPSGFATTLTGVITQHYGLYFGGSGTQRCRVANVHASGYYQQLPALLSQANNTTNFRDWNAPNLPPADTSGQITNGSAFFYRGCTMYGDAA